jgi:hypothetical protein
MFVLSVEPESQQLLITQATDKPLTASHATIKPVTSLKFPPSQPIPITKSELSTGFTELFPHKQVTSSNAVAVPKTKILPQFVRSKQLTLLSKTRLQQFV